MKYKLYNGYDQRPTRRPRRPASLEPEEFENLSRHDHILHRLRDAVAATLRIANPVRSGTILDTPSLELKTKLGD